MCGEPYHLGEGAYGPESHRSPVHRYVAASSPFTAPASRATLNPCAGMISCPVGRSGCSWSAMPAQIGASCPQRYRWCLEKNATQMAAVYRGDNISHGLAVHIPRLPQPRPPDRFRREDHRAGAGGAAAAAGGVGEVVAAEALEEQDPLDE